MKRVVIAMLALLLLSSVSALAVPSNVSYESTRSFLECCEADDLKYSYHGIDNDDDEEVRMEYTLDNTDVTVRMFFNENGSCSMRIWDLITYDPAQIVDVLTAVNTLNSQYKWGTFYLDTSDDTVTVSVDVEYGDNPAGEVCLTMLDRIVHITNEGYNALEEFNIG